MELLDKIDEGVPITNNGVYKLFISEPESPYLVLLDIGFAQSSTKTITIRSNYIIDNQTELDLIKEKTSPKNITYTRNEYGDTGEKNPVSYFRLQH